jgi:fluoride ion exporter CrcB/FEX
MDFFYLLNLVLKKFNTTLSIGFLFSNLVPSLFISIFYLKYVIKLDFVFQFHPNGFF